MMQLTRRDWLVRTGVGAALIGLSPALHAHAKLVRSAPKNGSELTEPPKMVQLWFNELLDDGFHTLELFPAADRAKKERKNFVKGKARVDKKDRTQIVAEVEKLPAGEYMAEYRVLSRDGHSAPGKFTFKVLPAL
jgi:methionine-rich copper-binding protein CopC